MRREGTKQENNKAHAAHDMMLDIKCRAIMSRNLKALPQKKSKDGSRRSSSPGTKRHAHHRPPSPSIINHPNPIAIVKSTKQHGRLGPQAASLKQQQQASVLPRLNYCFCHEVAFAAAAVACDTSLDKNI